MIENEQVDSPQVILNISKLTNEVHKLLFSKEAEFLQNGDVISSFNIGIIPQSLYLTSSYLSILPRSAF